MTFFAIFFSKITMVYLFSFFMLSNHKVKIVTPFSKRGWIENQHQKLVYLQKK